MLKVFFVFIIFQLKGYNSFYSLLIGTIRRHFLLGTVKNWKQISKMCVVIALIISNFEVVCSRITIRDNSSACFSNIGCSFLGECVCCSRHDQWRPLEAGAHSCRLWYVLTRPIDHPLTCCPWDRVQRGLGGGDARGEGGLLVVVVLRVAILVGPDVGVQVALLGEPLVAHWARVGLLPSVQPQVGDQVALLREPLVTLVAGEGTVRP